MRVVTMVSPGGPEVLQIMERPSLELPRDHVRVGVHTSGVNRADLLQRRGKYPVPPGYPEDILGMEFSGTILEVGAECRSRKVGDEVMGILGGGGYAEEIVLSEEETIRCPKGLSLLDAGAIPEVFITAWDALVRQARIQPGETVLLHSVGSGVGTAALQLCLAMGCRTIGTSRSEWKLERATAMGLHHAVLLENAESGGSWIRKIEGILAELPPHHAEENRGEKVRRSPANGRIHVLLDLVGGAYFEGNLRLMGERGRWVMVGLTSGNQGTLDLRTFIAKRVTLIGTVLRARSRSEKADLAHDFEKDIVPLFERGELRPIVDHTFPPEEVAEAHRYLERSANFGKILLNWAPKTREESR